MSLFGSNTLGATSTPAKPGGLFSSFSAGTPGFGAAATTSAPTSGFGSTATFGTTNFGSSATTTPTIGSFGAFGSQANKTTTAPTLGGFGGFGSTSTANANTTNTSLFGGLGTNSNTTAPTFGGFGAPASSSGQAFGSFGGFGNNAAKTSVSGFGNYANQNTGFGGFNAPGGIGSNFPKLGTGTTVTPGFGGFGNTNFMLGQPQQQAPQISQDEAFAHAVLNVNIYSGERDKILAKWNFLQSSWGQGKLFYSQNAPPTDVTPENVLCRFKAIAYSRLPGKDNKAGLVALTFNKPLQDVKNQQQQIITALNNILGNKPNLSVQVESNKEIEEKRCQIVIYVEEKASLASLPKRILATDLTNFLSQVHVKSQLGTMGICDVLALVLPDEDQLKEYLDVPPKGINEYLWQQAQKDNPDPKLFIPVPLVGFTGLKHRVKCQENEIEMQTLYLQKLEQDIAKLHERYRSSTAKILEHKRNAVELGHRILKVIIKQECTRKYGMPLTAAEEALKTKLENIQAIISAPTQFKGRISELLSQMRMQRNQFAGVNGTEYTIEKESEDEVKTFLSLQQNAIQVLIETISNDCKVLHLMLDDIKIIGSK